MPPGGLTNPILLSTSVSTCYGWIVHRPNLLGCIKNKSIFLPSLPLFTGWKIRLGGHSSIFKCQCHVNAKICEIQNNYEDKLGILPE